MAWFMPSYGRPERLRTMLDAPGGWPSTVFVLVNEDDPERERYTQIADQLLHEYRQDYGRGKKAPPWYLLTIPAGSRCADAHRWITSEASLPRVYYGLLCDDHWPVTPKWWETMEAEAGDRYISASNGSPLFPKIRSAVCFGGKLVEAMGSLVPAPMKHNFEDDLWDKIAEDYGILKPLKDVVVEHRHPIHGTANTDTTYKRGSADFLQDQRLFEQWLQSEDRVALYERLDKLFGATAVEFDPSGIDLAIICPVQNNTVDLAYHSSLFLTLRRLMQAGVKHSLQETGGGSHIGKARENLLWKAYYQDPKPTHILFIDDDMGWDAGLVTRLLAADHEFAAIPGVRKQDVVSVCANFWQGEQERHPTTGFIKVQEVGFAFVLIKTSVVEKMIAAYPELRYHASRPEWALFMDLIAEPEDGAEYGQRMSEDFSFCRRWRNIGGEIWVDPRARLIHAGRKEYTGCIMDVAAMQAA